MRDIRFPEALPDRVITLSNTATAATALQPVVRTVDATTNFAIDGAAHAVKISLKLVDAKGVAMRGVVNFAVVATGATLANDAFGASVGTLVGPNNGATTPAGGSINIMAASTGIVTATCTLSGAGTALVVVTFCGYQIVVPALTIA